MSLTPKRPRNHKRSPKRQQICRQRKIISFSEFTSDEIFSKCEIMIVGHPPNQRSYFNRVYRILDWKMLKLHHIPDEIILMIKLKYGDILK